MKVLRAIVSNNADVNLVKTHNIAGDVGGVTLIPRELTRSVVYIVRNPLDMVISYANHFGLEKAAAVDAIGRSDNVVMGDDASVIQFLGSWSEHVQSWAKGVDKNTLIIRYEDMLENPTATFTDLLQHLGVPVHSGRLQRAIKFSQFDELAKQEASVGFGEKSAYADRFFGAGKSGRWRDELSDDLVKQIRLRHKRSMKQYGYWND
ncbi:sulfotransferase [Roseobacter sp. AzwK-3b]|nr:sulfotransferase [Roseobacter sp. AzwK-3b]